MDLKNQIINEVVQNLGQLSQNATQEIQDVLCIVLNNYEIQERTTEIAVADNSLDSILRKYLATKRIEGKSEKTISRYRDINHHMLHTIGKPLSEIDTYDIRYYLAQYKSIRKVKNSTLNGMRRCISSFFSWLTAEGFISHNPCLGIPSIKCTKTVRKPFSPTELDALKRVCNNRRDLALLEFLYSTGCRVSETISINIDDINWKANEIVILGKGNKERVVYLTEISAHYLSQYLDSRQDTNPSLFVSLKKPHKRLTKEGVEAILKRIGEKANVSNVHPHRYRRTLATTLLSRGASLQDVATILGHADFKTTQIYCYIDQRNVKASHARFAA